MSAGDGVEPRQPQLPRRSARLAAVQAVYEIAVSDADVETILDNFLHQRWPRSGANDRLPPPDLRLLTTMLRGVVAATPALDQEIDAILANRRGAERIELLLRAILRVGAFELMAMEAVPTKVILNEYINLAHAFFAGGEPALVNAVLDRLALRYRGPANVLS
ncbi:MAG: transcription antitermination factor NusB [Rhodospirillales bacterium]